MTKKFDWIKFFIHAFFGAVLGAMIGYGITVFLSLFMNVSLLFMMFLGALVYGLIAGVRGDKFWDLLRR